MKRTVTLLTLALGILAAPAAMAQSDLGFKSIGGAVGFVSPEDIDGTYMLGIFVDHGTIAPRVGLESHLDYWSKSEEAFGAKSSVSDIPVGARAKYYFPVSNPSIRPFAGGGLAIHFLHAEATIPAQFGFPEMKVEDSSTKLGLDLGGGIATTVGPRTDLLAESWFAIVSDVSQFSLKVGLSYKL
jgi:opacity protein-like surface antigen